MTFVLDNSVAMRWCFESAAHPYADGILKRLAAGTALRLSGSRLILRLEEGSGVFAGESVVRRLDRLAQAVGLEAATEAVRDQAA